MRSTMSSEDIVLEQSCSKDYMATCSHGQCPNPGTHTCQKKIVNNDLIYNVSYKIGQDRTRILSIDQSHSKKAKEPIVLNIFGGSFAFGEGLEDEQTLHYYLSEFVPGLDIKNYSFHGHGMHNALFLLENKLSRDSQINVFLTSAFHAERSGCLMNYTKDHPFYMREEEGSERKTKFAGYCEEKIKKLNVFEKSLQTLSRNSELVKYTMEDLIGGFAAENLMLYQSIISDLTALSQGQGAIPVFVYLKEKPTRFLKTGYRSDPMPDFFARHGINSFDATLGTDRSQLDADLYLHRYDRHPSALANCFRAERLAVYLKEAGLIDPQSVNFEFRCHST